MTGGSSLATEVNPTFRFSQLGLPGEQGRALLPRENGAFHYSFHGRYSIHQALLAMRRKDRNTVLLPAYNCPVVDEAVIVGGFEPRYYDLGPDLSPDATDVDSKWGDDVAAILVVNFFGFPADGGVIDAARRRSVPVIEDCSHSFLYTDPLRLAGGRGDANTYSFWKTVPCLVGGGLEIANAVLRPPRVAPMLPLRESLRVTKRLLDQALEAAGWSAATGIVRRLQDLRRNARAGTTAVAGHSGAAGSGRYSSYELDRSLLDGPIPWISRRILASADLSGIARARRRNYLAYHEGIRESARIRRIFPVLPEHVCPWVFPVIIEGREREALDFKLRDRGVRLHTFGNVPHPQVPARSSPATLEKALYLADNLVCLCVQQDIPQSEIAVSCDTINEFLHAR